VGWRAERQEGRRTRRELRVGEETGDKQESALRDAAGEKPHLWEQKPLWCERHA